MYIPIAGTSDADAGDVAAGGGDTSGTGDAGAAGAAGGDTSGTGGDNAAPGADESEADASGASDAGTAPTSAAGSGEAAAPTPDTQASNDANGAASDLPQPSTSIPDINWWTSMVSDTSGFPTAAPSASETAEASGSASEGK